MRGAGGRRIRPFCLGNLLDDARLELHRTKAGNLRVDVVTVDSLFEQANAANLRTDLERAAAGALDLEILHDRDGVTVFEYVADRVLDDGLGLRSLFRGSVPLVTAHGAGQERARLVGELARAGRAGGKLVSHDDPSLEVTTS